MISYATNLISSRKIDRDLVRFAHCVFNHDVPMKTTEKKTVIITVLEKNEDRFLRWAYENKILCNKIEKSNE